MKFSLLEIVQDILNDIDSDSVNSIDDTIESQQVAQIVRSCFNEMISNRNWPHLKKMVQLEPSNTLLRPNYLQLPVGTKELIFIRYDKRKATETKLNYQDIKYKEPHDFLKYVSQRDTTQSNVQLINDFSGVTMSVYKDRAPEYWTSFDDSWLVFDAYDNAVDSTLQKVKSQAMAYIEPTWVHLDDAIPDLPEEAFSALIEEAKSTASLALKQLASQKAEQKASRQQRWLSRKAWRANGGINYPDYGRKR